MFFWFFLKILKLLKFLKKVLVSKNLILNIFLKFCFRHRIDLTPSCSKTCLFPHLGEHTSLPDPQSEKIPQFCQKNSIFCQKNGIFCQNGEILKILGENFGNSYCEFFIKVGSRSVYLSTYRLKSIWQKTTPI